MAQIQISVTVTDFETSVKVIIGHDYEQNKQVSHRSGLNGFGMLCSILLHVQKIQKTFFSLFFVI